MNHDEVLTRWVPSHLLKSRTPTNASSTIDNSGATPTGTTTSPINSDYKAAKRALSVAYQNLKAAKKQRKLGPNPS